MKNLLLFCALCSFSVITIAQPISYQDRLYYACKVWGYTKNYHSEVSVCNVNWDSVLTQYLPAVKAASTVNDFNDVLGDMLAAAGPMSIAVIPPPTPAAPELSRNLNFGWINDPTIRADIKTILDTIKNNFRPHAGCWVKNNPSSLAGWLLFPHDSLMLDLNTYVTYPSESERLLMLFKYWNIINYFNPYNYVLDIPWDSTLHKYAIDIANAGSAAELNLLIEKMTATLDDAHVEGLTYNQNTSSQRAFVPQILLRYIPNKYIVVKSGITGVAVGDEIVTVGGLTPTQWEDSLRPYTSAGNPDRFRRFMCQYILGGTQGSTVDIELKDVNNTNYSTTAIRNYHFSQNWFNDYHPIDTLANTVWTTLDCNVAYVHMGNTEPNDVFFMYKHIRHKPVIIFDIRNYPNGTAFTLADYLYPDNRQFSRLIEPDVNYPGLFFWFNHFLGSANNPDPYNGKIIILMNQQTQSHAEYSCMIFEAMPDVIKVGSPTAGADGNISFFKLTNDIMRTGFTTLGVYYPNGDSTQRIGIVPDSLVYPTQAGIRAGRDEVLEKAMQIACKVSVQDNYENDISAKIYPNPANGVLNIELPTGRSATLTITEITGRVLLRTDMTAIYNCINIESLMPGVYLLKMESEERQQTFKFIKQ